VYDKIAATDAGGASEQRTVSVGPVQASARTTICNSKQEGEEFWNKKTLIACTIVSAHCHCYNILVKNCSQVLHALGLSSWYSEAAWLNSYELALGE
jgi:hypothetical protein